MKQIPYTIQKVLDDLEDHNPVIVGGYLKYLLGEAEDYTDVDILLLDYSNDPVTPSIHTGDVGENYYGGLRYEVDNVKFDVWKIKYTSFLQHIETPTVLDYLKSITKNVEFKKAFIVKDSQLVESK